MVFHAVIPARFLALTAHFILNVMVFWSRVSVWPLGITSSVLNCLGEMFVNLVAHSNIKTSCLFLLPGW